MPLNNVFISTLNKHAPLIDRNNGIIWLNKDIKVLMFKCDRYKSVGNFEQYKCFPNIVVNEIRKNKAKFYNSLINNATGNICKFWKVVNDLRGSSKKQQTIKTIKINES